MKKTSFAIFVSFLGLPLLTLAQNNGALHPGPTDTVGGGLADPAGGSQTGDADVLPRTSTKVPDQSPSAKDLKSASEPSAGSASKVSLGSDTITPAAAATPPSLPSQPVRLNSTALANQIRIQPATTRGALLSGLDTRLENSEREIEEMKAGSTHFTGTARDAFGAAFTTYKIAQKALKHSLRAAHDSTAEQWPTARTALAHDFEAYSVALARLEANAAIDH